MPLPSRTSSWRCSRGTKTTLVPTAPRVERALSGSGAAIYPPHRYRQRRAAALGQRYRDYRYRAAVHVAASVCACAAEGRDVIASVRRFSRGLRSSLAASKMLSRARKFPGGLEGFPSGLFCGFSLREKPLRCGAGSFLSGGASCILKSLGNRLKLHNSLSGS